MKTIEVNITAEFIVPDDWDVVEHVPDPQFPEDIRRVLNSIMGEPDGQRDDVEELEGGDF